MSSKVKYDLEIPFHASPSMIFQYISDATCLSEWFADKVTTKKDIFSFTWDDDTKFAKLHSSKYNERVKFIWLDENLKETDYYFEIRILEDEITNDISIYITDFAFIDEVEEEKQLWNNFINDFKYIIGAVS